MKFLVPPDKAGVIAPKISVHFCSNDVVPLLIQISNIARRKLSINVALGTGAEEVALCLENVKNSDAVLVAREEDGASVDLQANHRYSRGAGGFCGNIGAFKIMIFAGYVGLHVADGRGTFRMKRLKGWMQLQ